MRLARKTEKISGLMKKIDLESIKSYKDKKKTTLMERLYKYYPEDFGKLPVKVIHYDLNFDVYSDHTLVIAKMKMQAIDNLTTITLDAKNLEIKSVECKEHPCEYKYKTEEDKLEITFKKEILAKTIFTIINTTICKPTNNVLEGLYYDVTPEGLPPTQITQCQQWGFQRITPCFDDMTAKCTYITTINADSRYTHMISNGDIAIKRHSIGNGRDSITYNNTITPMAPYLFFLGVGTYAEFSKEFEYPNGETFILELLTRIDTEKIIADQALRILHDSILWIHIFTGKESTQELEKRKKLYSLVLEREKQKLEGKNIESLRNEIKKLSDELTLGYKYTGTVYREIGMQNSDIGGMENVGNTTITMNRLMPFNDMTDGPFEYLFNVKVHEFYHNLNGSEVTGKDPFQLWLNEAVTVHIERGFSSFIFGEDYIRLHDVLGFLSPGGGTFAQDDGPASMPIQPEGFNNPNELITVITYVKAPELVRMVETLIGKENFAKGLALYHSRFKHGNATSEDWASAMEEVSGKKLKTMMKTWLENINYPHVHLSKNYDKDNKKLKITLEQLGEKTWEFPFLVALCDKNGNEVAESTTHITNKKQDIIFQNIENIAYVSFNRGYSFYGKIKHEIPEEELFIQARTDKDITARYQALYKLFDNEKMRLIKEGGTVREEIILLYYELLTNKELLERAGTSILTIFENVEDEANNYDFQKLYDVRKLIHKTIAQNYEKELTNLYFEYSLPVTTEDYIENAVKSLKLRGIKNTFLGILSTLDTPEVHELIKKQYDTADNATDKIVALRLSVNSSATEKSKLIMAHWELAKKDPVSWETFLYVIGGSDAKDSIEQIRTVWGSKDFHIEQTNEQHGLFSAFIRNRKQSLQTLNGRKLTEEILLKMVKINEYNSLDMVKVLGVTEKMNEEYFIPLVEILVKVLENVNAQDQPSIYHTTKRMLLNMKKALEQYEMAKGPVLGLRD